MTMKTEEDQWVSLSFDIPESMMKKIIAKQEYFHFKTKAEAVRYLITLGLNTDKK